MRNGVRLTVVLAIVIVGACARHHPAVVMDPEVYAAAVVALFPGGPPLATVIRREVIPIPRLAESAAFGGVDSFGFRNQSASMWEDVPMALRRGLTLRQSTDATPLTLAILPFTVRLAPGAEVEPTDSLAFSKVLIARDSKEAVVYYERHCGNLCGTGAYLWLHRASPSTTWTLGKRIVVWMS
jgi:hypothetical protein